MNDQRPDGLDPDAAERLLDGGRDDPPDEHQALRLLLAAAGAPPRPEELAGEEAAVAAFQAARSATPLAQGVAADARRANDAKRLRRRGSRGRSRGLPQFMTVKAAAVACALTTFGGSIALAAGHGYLPGRDTSPSPTHRVPSRSPHVSPKISPPQSPSPSPRQDQGRHKGNDGKGGKPSSKASNKATQKPGKAKNGNSSSNGNGNSSSNGNSGNGNSGNHGSGSGSDPSSGGGQGSGGRNTKAPKARHGMNPGKGMR